MSFVLSSAGVVRQLDTKAVVDDSPSETDVQDPGKLVRVLIRILRSIANLQRVFRPRRGDYEGRVVDATGTTKYRFVHKFGGRVRWWPVDWTSSGGAGCTLEKSATDSTNDVLVLVSHSAGTVTVRIEEAG